MIELKIDGVCKGCPFKELTLTHWRADVRCKHETVCKFIGDPDGEARLKAVQKVVQEKELEQMRERMKELDD